MAYNKVWYHTGAPCNGCNGIGDMWRQLDAAAIPFGVYSVEGAGLIVEAAQYRHAETLIYRMLATDVAEYHLPPAEAAARAWATTIAKMPPELVPLKSRIWIEIGNEQDKTRADWLGWYYVELAGHALAQGWNICGPGWSTGEPEPEHWETPGWLAYLRLCAANPTRLAVTVHEYSLDAESILSGTPWLVGRVVALLNACDRHGIAHPAVFVTEAGWTHNDLPGAAVAKADIETLATLYAQIPAVRAAFLWTLIGGGDKRTLAAELNVLMPWLTQYSITTRFPDPRPVDPPPQPDPETPMSNLLKNGSFEDGWTDSDSYSTTQNPRHWTVEWNSGANPYGGQPYELGECVHKSRAMLPAAERDVFVWDGQWTLKVFAGGRSIWPRLKQTADLAPGRYRLTLPVWVDCYRWDGGKDYDIDPRHTEIQVKVNGAAVGEWQKLQAGGKRTPAFEFDHPGGAADIAVHFRCNWAISNNLWLDGWSLTAVTVAPPPPPPAEPPPAGKHKAIVVKLPQDMTAQEWQEAAAYAYQYRHTMTASHDDMLTVLRGGNAESYVKLAWAGRQPDTAALITESGYRWQAIPELDRGPLDGLKLGRPFAFRYVLTSPFNATRSYGKHEGADYDVLGGTADNAVDVLCLYPGTVDRAAETPGGYGRYVRVRHERNGHTFYTRYAHLDLRYVQVGYVLKQGDPVGELGNTGNSTAEHVHINLEVPGYGLDGYVVPDVVDPAPFIPSGAGLPLVSDTVDLLDYLRGDGRMYEVRHPDGKTETFQTQVDGPWFFYQVKNSQWEQFHADSDFIWRGWDTSPGGGRMYIQYEPGHKAARWAMRRMRPGQTWIGSGHTVQFYRKADCKPSALSSGQATNVMKFVARHTAKTWNGITVPDVVELSDGTERFFYGKGFGLVAWSSPWGESAIVQVYQPGERPPLVRENIPCLSSL